VIELQADVILTSGVPPAEDEGAIVVNAFVASVTSAITDPLLVGGEWRWAVRWLEGELIRRRSDGEALH
jgi:hypothetical protein